MFVAFFKSNLHYAERFSAPRLFHYIWKHQNCPANNTTNNPYDETQHPIRHTHPQAVLKFWWVKRSFRKRNRDDAVLPYFILLLSDKIRRHTTYFFVYISLFHTNTRHYQVIIKTIYSTIYRTPSIRNKRKLSKLICTFYIFVIAQQITNATFLIQWKWEIQPEIMRAYQRCAWEETM